MLQRQDGQEAGSPSSALDFLANAYKKRRKNRGVLGRIRSARSPPREAMGCQGYNPGTPKETSSSRLLPLVASPRRASRNPRAEYRPPSTQALPVHSDSRPPRSDDRLLIHVRRSALECARVFRLITSSNLASRSTGRSAGLALLRIRRT